MLRVEWYQPRARSSASCLRGSSLLRDLHQESLSEDETTSHVIQVSVLCVPAVHPSSVGRALPEGLQLPLNTNDNPRARMEVSQSNPHLPGPSAVPGASPTAEGTMAHRTQGPLFPPRILYWAERENKLVNR